MEVRPPKFSSFFILVARKVKSRWVRPIPAQHRELVSFDTSLFALNFPFAPHISGVSLIITNNGQIMIIAPSAFKTARIQKSKSEKWKKKGLEGESFTKRLTPLLARYTG